jgi:hypothetical protein
MTGNQRITGESLYLRMQDRIGELMVDVPPRERANMRSKLIYAFCAGVWDIAAESVWIEFDDAMHAHGYHRYSDCSEAENACEQDEGA